MPRTVLKVRQPAELEDADAAALEGFPQNGEEFNDDEPAEGAAEGEVEPNEPAARPEPQFVSKQDFDNLQSQLAAMQQMIVQNSGQPAQRGPAQRSEPASIDYGKAFYDDPNAAVDLIRKQLKEDIERDLTNKYTADTGRRNFWDRFYRAHPDLEDSADLVESTLNSNMNTLGGQSIPKAVEGLAALTRARIAGYVDKASKNRGRKATVEGAGPTLPNSARPNRVQDQQPYSLSASIKARRAKRAGAV